MRIIIHHALSFGGLVLPGASASPKITPNCSDVTFNLPIVSQNVIFASPPNPDNTAEILEFIHTEVPAINGTRTIRDTFAIAGTFCHPPDHSQPPKGLQILLHGIMYNKTMWAGGGFPEYDWHAFATARGYATLALDRLGHGANPQRPDPLTVVQPQLQIDLIHSIIAAVRDPSSSSSSAAAAAAAAVSGADIGQAFSTIILVGHSFGSFLSAGLAAQYPEDADALVLTGWSGQADSSRLAAANWVSAGAWQPERFGADLAAGYLTLSEAAEREAAFFAGGYDAAVAAADFAGEDTVTAGELGALSTIIGPAVGYTGDVLVATGVEDAIFCVAPIESCEAILRETAAAGFPDARSFDYYAPTNTGHVLTLHYSAAATADEVHDWLDSKVSGVKANRARANIFSWLY